jgi:hypothetical protein
VRAPILITDLGPKPVMVYCRSYEAHINTSPLYQLMYPRYRQRQRGCTVVRHEASPLSHKVPVLAFTDNDGRVLPPDEFYNTTNCVASRGFPGNLLVLAAPKVALQYLRLV